MNADTERKFGIDKLELDSRGIAEKNCARCRMLRYAPHSRFFRNDPPKCEVHCEDLELDDHGPVRCGECVKRDTDTSSPYYIAPEYRGLGAGK
jgi:hypothetical protein